MGSTLLPVAKPDAIIRHSVDRCEVCALDLSDVEAENVVRRQIIDIPHVPYQVTEHQAEIKICPSGHTTRAPFPPGVNAPVQYGPNIQARIAYMHAYQLLPVDRIREWFRDEWHLPLSTGPVMRSLRDVANRLAPVMERVRVAVEQDPNTVCCDETGMRVMGGQWWFHVATTARLTWLFAHKHRGHEAMDAAGILPNRPENSNTMHDGLTAYKKYPGRASLCNAHHERELEDAVERTDQQWARQLGELLYEMNDAGRVGGVLPNPVPSSNRT